MEKKKRYESNDILKYSKNDYVTQETCISSALDSYMHDDDVPIGI